MTVTVSALLAYATDIMKERGLCDGYFMHPKTGQVCAHGALNLAWWKMNGRSVSDLPGGYTEHFLACDIPSADTALIYNRAVKAVIEANNLPGDNTAMMSHRPWVATWSNARVLAGESEKVIFAFHKAAVETAAVPATGQDWGP